MNNEEALALAYDALGRCKANDEVRIMDAQASQEIQREEPELVAMLAKRIELYRQARRAMLEIMTTDI